MTVTAGQPTLVARGSDLGARLDGLADALAAARGRLEDALVDDVSAVVDRAAGRLRLSSEHTVVGIAGATGSGKSSTFNALTGLELSAVGVRRPTTSWATACVWGSEGAREVLDWLGIPARHQTTRDSMLDTRREGNSLDGLVLLDLPDHDSTEVAHHLEVDRLVVMADVLVWVLDPQKYADAAIHDRYLSPMRGHADIMIVVLNHIDTVAEDRRESMIADVRRLLADDGLASVPVYAISARHGLGLDALRAELERRVADKATRKMRVADDVRASAVRLAVAAGETEPPVLTSGRVTDLEDAIAEAAGVPSVVDAVERSARLRMIRATGWPVTSWLSRFSADPLRRRESDPAMASVQGARVDTEVRALVDELASGLQRPWVRGLERATFATLPEVSARIDAAVSSVDLEASRVPGWARFVTVLQVLATLAGVLGIAWGAVDQVRSLDLGPDPIAGVGFGWVLGAGGLALGLVLAIGCRFFVRGAAASRAQQADARLRTAVASVVADLVVAPIETELAAYRAVQTGLARARG